jgi:GT2 family glycosyltransferase
VRVAVITIVSGRHAHLAAQSEALNRSAPRPGHHIVVAMGAGELAACRAACGGASDVIAVACSPAGLPLARARNTGAQHALDHRAELLVFLDVDCIPCDRLLRRYIQAADAVEHALLCGPVGYLPPAPPEGYATARLAALARPHPARPVPPDDALQPDGDHRLFWTLSFAVTAGTWQRIGGFCEEYTGYGGEDTDYGQLARRAGVQLCWVGGAWAFHQYHPTTTPPAQHLHDILRNAALFKRRWGWLPMTGWLKAFAERGLAYHDAVTDTWHAATP